MRIEINNILFFPLPKWPNANKRKPHLVAMVSSWQLAVSPKQDAEKKENMCICIVFLLGEAK